VHRSFSDSKSFNCTSLEKKEKAVERARPGSLRHGYQPATTSLVPGHTSWKASLKAYFHQIKVILARTRQTTSGTS